MTSDSRGKSGTYVCRDTVVNCAYIRIPWYQIHIKMTICDRLLNSFEVLAINSNSFDDWILNHSLATNDGSLGQILMESDVFNGLKMKRIWIFRVPHWLLEIVLRRSITILTMHLTGLSSYSSRYLLFSTSRLFGGFQWLEFAGDSVESTAIINQCCLYSRGNINSLYFHLSTICRYLSKCSYVNDYWRQLRASDSLLQLVTKQRKPQRLFDIQWPPWAQQISSQLRRKTMIMRIYFTERWCHFINFILMMNF